MLDHEILARLARTHGDAFYLLDLDRFRANLRDLAGAFRAVHPSTTLGYSYKTNYTPILCRVADEEGALAEVVSRMELDLALRIGVPGERIVFNGPLKSADDLEAALLAGALVNVDSLDEVAAIEAIATRHPDARLRVGLRSHVAVGGDGSSRFGLDGDDLRAARARLGRVGPDRRDVVVGLHCHLSGHRDAAAFRVRAERLVALAKELFPGTPPATIDIGGGLFGRLSDSLRAQFPGGVPAWTEVAQAAGEVIAAAYPGPDTPMLIVEPGTAVVADAVAFVCRVAGLKSLGGRTLAVTTGSLQTIKASRNAIRLPIDIVPTGSSGSPGAAASPGPVDLVGYTCMEGDVLQEDVPGPVAVGDLVVIGSVGAYASVFKPPFIRPAPAMIATGGPGGATIVVRRAETLDDILATYLVPPMETP